MAQPQPTARWGLTVWSQGSLYILTCDFFLEIHYFFKDITVNIEYTNQEKVIVKVSLIHWVYK